MSLYIDVDKVTKVLLIDGWYKVANQSFDLDAYEYHHGDLVLLGGGREELIPATGARWETDLGDEIYCPLTSILAVRYKQE